MNNYGFASTILLIGLLFALVAGGGALIARKAFVTPSPTPMPSPILPPDQVVGVTVQPPAAEPTIDPNAPTVTITGVADCLPHKGNGDVQTMECAFGIKDSKDEYYGVQMSPDQIITFITGNTYKIEGTLEAVPNSNYRINSKINVKSLTDLGKK